MKLFDESLPYPLAFTIGEISIIQLDVDPRDESVVKGSNAIGCEEEEAIIEFECPKESCELLWSVLVFLVILCNCWQGIEKLGVFRMS